MMKRRTLLSSVLVAAGASLPRVSTAQVAGRPARIGWVTAQRAASLAPYVATFRAGLADLGRTEGRDVAIEFRYADDVPERVPSLVDELVRLPVDVIVAQGEAVSTINEMKLTVPIVYVTSGDPVLSGFADSLARPHPNMTGLTFMSVEFNGKRLELLREIVPTSRRVAIIANPEHPGEVNERAYSVDAGRKLGLSVQLYATRTGDDLTAAFATMARDPPQGLILFSDGFAVQNRVRIIEAATRLRIPVLAGWAVFAESGAVCTYGPRLSDSYRRLAYYVDRILKGAKPAELPIEQPATFEMVVNLKAAQDLGLAIPPAVLLRADRLIQ